MPKTNQIDSLKLCIDRLLDQISHCHCAAARYELQYDLAILEGMLARLSPSDAQYTDTVSL